MTTLRQAAEIALEALGKTMGVWGGTRAWHNDVEEAITTLKEALAQHQIKKCEAGPSLQDLWDCWDAAHGGQTPVAYRYKDSRAHYRYVGNRPNMDTSSYTILKLEPLYPRTAPIPEGWQLVPKEPTVNMLTALLTTYVDEGIPYGYKAMLAAAPKYEEQSK